MFLICLKDGDDCKNWEDSLRVVDDLLFSVEPMSSTESRQRLLKLVPNLLKNLRTGLTKIGYNPFDMNQLFADLEAIHLTQLKELNTVALDMADAPVAKAPQAKGNAAHTKVIEQTLDQMLDSRDSGSVSLEQLDAELDQQLAEFDALADLVERAAGDESAPVAAREPEDSPLVRQVVKKLQISGATSAKAEKVEPLDDDDPCLKKVDSMAMGNWVELHQDDGKKFRCRLAAIIRGTGKFIFVNRSGMKVAEYNRMSLAQAIKQGRISTLDEGLLFDRALESVIGNLRKMKMSPA